MSSVSSNALPPNTHGRHFRRGAIVLLSVAVLAVAGWFAFWHVWALSHLRSAEQALRRCDFVDALDHLEQCLRVWPHSASTRLFSGANCPARRTL